MKTYSEPEFVGWAERAGFALDPRYPQSAVLRLCRDSEHDRFWVVPDRAESRPYFIGSLLELMGEWQSCYVWRNLGSWPKSADARRPNDVVELRILKGLDLPLGTAAIVEFSRAEFDTLVTLIFATTIFGWSVGQDLYVVPNDGRHLMKVSHHEVIHVSFRTEADLAQCVLEMEHRGFPLPDEVPDPTFKQPSWMKKT